MKNYKINELQALGTFLSRELPYFDVREAVLREVADDAGSLAEKEACSEKNSSRIMNCIRVQATWFSKRRSERNGPKKADTILTMIILCSPVMSSAKQFSGENSRKYVIPMAMNVKYSVQGEICTAAIL